MKKQIPHALKIWLYVDGPKKILDYVQEWDRTISAPQFMHACQVCAYIYQNAKIQEVIRLNFKKCYKEVLDRFTAKQTLMMSKTV